MNKPVLGWKTKMLLSAVVSVGLLVFGGCGGGGNPGNGGNPDNGEDPNNGGNPGGNPGSTVYRDKRLILEDGYEWRRGNEGMEFLEDGRFIETKYYDTSGKQIRYQDTTMLWQTYHWTGEEGFHQIREEVDMFYTYKQDTTKAVDGIPYRVESDDYGYGLKYLIIGWCPRHDYYTITTPWGELGYCWDKYEHEDSISFEKWEDQWCPSLKRGKNGF